MREGSLPMQEQGVVTLKSSHNILFTFLLRLLFLLFLLNNGDCVESQLGVLSPSEQFLVIGSPHFGGVGNNLIFYPSAFAFALLTDRRVVILDHSDIGLMCRVLTCGPSFLSTVSALYPSDNAVHPHKQNSMQGHYEGRPLSGQRFVTFLGSMPKSDWFVWHERLNGAATKVAGVTGCPLGDISCMERYALRTLFTGPVTPAFQGELLSMLEGGGGGERFRLGLASLPRTRAPHIDATVHLRNQFSHFERKSAVDDPEYLKEVDAWLAGEERATVFHMIREKLVEQLNSSDYRRQHEGGRNYTVFVAGDNEAVKQALRAWLEAAKELPLEVLVARSEGIVHIGADAHTHGEDVMKTIAFDWHLISLSQLVLGWRVGGARLQSTFLHSAQRAGEMTIPRESLASSDVDGVDSGSSFSSSVSTSNNDSTNTSTVERRGTSGFVLMKHPRRAQLQWETMFQYGVWDVSNL